MTILPRMRKKSLPPSVNKGKYYPVFLDLLNKKCIIIGGGKVAERKCLSLLKAGARVAVISPELTRRLEVCRVKGLIAHIKRDYRKGDIRSAYLVIAATDSEETNKRVAAEASGRNVLLNVADNPELCNFIAPSVIGSRSLIIAISTSGVSPAVAKAIRIELEGLYGRDFSGYLEFLKKIRPEIIKKVTDKRKRETLLKKMASAGILSVLRGKGFKEAKKTALNYLKEKE